MPGSRISVNKLGEYLVTSNPTRRRSIVRNQKQPADVVVARYRKAIDPIGEFLNSGGENVEQLLQAAAAIRNEQANTDWAVDDNANTAEALEQFLEIADSLPFDGMTYVRGDHAPPRLNIEGVEISVRPDFLLQFNRRGRASVGLLKLHFIKNPQNSPGQVGQQFVATISHQWLLNNPPHDRTVDRTHCLSVDVFSGNVVSAPASFSRRMEQVQAACSEIALLWPNL